MGERGGGAHRKNICPEFLPESFSFLFMKLYRNVYQIKTVSHTIMVAFPLFVQSYGPLIVFLCLFCIDSSFEYPQIDIKMSLAITMHF